LLAPSPMQFAQVEAGAAVAAVETATGIPVAKAIGIGIATGVIMWLLERFILDPSMGKKGPR
jgi:hypothetical protein